MEHETMLPVKANEHSDLKHDNSDTIMRPYSLNERCEQLEIMNKELMLTVKHQQQLINHLLNVNLRKHEMIHDEQQILTSSEPDTPCDEKITTAEPEAEKAKPEFGEVYKRYCRLPLGKKIRKPTVQGEVRMLFIIYEAGNELEFGKVNTSCAVVTNYRHAKQLKKLGLMRIFYKEKKHFYAITENGKMFMEGKK